MHILRYILLIGVIGAVVGCAHSGGVPEKEDSLSEWRKEVLRKFSDPRYRVAFGMAACADANCVSSSQDAKGNARAELAKTFRVTLSGTREFEKSGTRGVDGATTSESSFKALTTEMFDEQLIDVESNEVKRSQSGDAIEAAAVMDTHRVGTFLAQTAARLLDEAAKIQSKYPKCQASVPSSVNGWRTLSDSASKFSSLQDYAIMIGQTDLMPPIANLTVHSAEIASCRQQVHLTVAPSDEVPSILVDRVRESLSREGFSLVAPRRRTPASSNSGSSYRLTVEVERGLTEPVGTGVSISARSTIGLIFPDGTSVSRSTKRIREIATDKTTLDTKLNIKLSLETARVLEALLKESL